MLHPLSIVLHPILGQRHIAQSDVSCSSRRIADMKAARVGGADKEKCEKLLCCAIFAVSLPWHKYGTRWNFFGKCFAERHAMLQIVCSAIVLRSCRTGCFNGMSLRLIP